MSELTPEQIEAAVERVRLGELSDAIRSAGRAVYIHSNDATAAEYDDAHPHEVWNDVLRASAALAAARPLIERELREQIAAETRAMGFAASMTGRTLAKRGQPHLSAECAWNEARDTVAARIARGGASDAQ